MKAISKISDIEGRRKDISELKDTVTSLERGEHINYVTRTYKPNEIQYKEHLNGYRALLMNAMQSLRDDILLAKYIVALAGIPDDEIPSQEEIDAVRKAYDGK